MQAVARTPRRRAQFGALVYLHWRSALRKWQLVARDPLRRLAWMPYVLSVMWLVAVRVTHLRVPVDLTTWTYVGALLPPAFFVLLAMSRAAGGRLHESRAHAHLVGGLGMPIWLLIATQRVLRMPVMLWNFGLFGVLLLPALFGVGPERVLGIAVAGLLTISVLSGLGLVSFWVRLRHPRLGTAWTVTAIVLALAVAAPASELASGRTTWWMQPLVFAARWSPGGLLQAGAVGDLVSDAVLLVLAVAVLALGAYVSRDLGPDLAEASYRHFVLVESARAAGGGVGASGANMRSRDPVQKSASTRLRGAGVLAWKTWLEFVRGGSGRWRLVTAGVQLLFGVFGGLVWWALTAGEVASSSFKTFLIGGVVLAMVATGFSSGRQFGPLLRSPVFALNRDSLSRRLAAQLLARQAADSIGNLATWVGVGLVLPFSIPMVAVLFLVSRGVAIAVLGLDLFVFSWLPSLSDRTMTMRIVRTVVAAIAVPIGTGFALLALHSGTPELVLLLPVPLLLVTGWILVAAAGGRLEGNGLAVAVAERR